MTKSTEGTCQIRLQSRERWESFNPRVCGRPVVGEIVEFNGKKTPCCSMHLKAHDRREAKYQSEKAAAASDAEFRTAVANLSREAGFTIQAYTRPNYGGGPNRLSRAQVVVSLEALCGLLGVEVPK